MCKKKSNMRKKIVFIFTVLLLVFHLQNVFSQNDKLEKFKNYVENSFYEWDIPSVAVAVVQDGKIVYSQAYGYTDLDKKKPVDANTLYPIGSISKSFTALALAQLIDNKQLTWDTKVKDIVPDFKLYNDYVTMNATVEDLVCHRIGFATFSGDLLWYHTNYSVDDIIKRMQYLKPVFDFRNGFGYSNLMFLVAGKVVENVSGMKFEDYVEQNILKPLQMQRTTYQLSEMEKEGNFAHGTFINTDNQKVNIDFIPSHNIQAFGGVNSSVTEMANYMIMLMNNGKFNGQQIVSVKQIDYLWEMHNPIGVSKYDKRMHPERHFYGYGLGWFVYDKNGYKIVTHDGGMDGALSRLMMIPEKNMGVIILTNCSNFLYTALGEYFVDLFTSDKEPRDWSDYYLKLSPRYRMSYVRMKNEYKKIPGTKPSFDLSEYAGTYTDKMYGDVNVVNDNGKLSLHFVPAPYLDADLTHWHYDVFEMKFKNPNMAIPTQWGLIQFFKDVNGKIKSFKLIVPNYDFLFDELDFEKQK